MSLVAGNETIQESAANLRGGWLEHRFRSAVFARLAKLQDGMLRIHEQGQVFEFGDQEGELQGELFIHQPRFYASLATGGSLAAAESFVRGDWGALDLVTTIQLLARNRDVLLALDGAAGWLRKPASLLLNLWNRNSKDGSRRNISAHYDLGNDFFQLFLDSTMTYSSGVFATDDATMRDASMEKNDRACRKLGLNDSHHLVEIGTGWGGFAIHAASRYGCRVTTTTISEQQYRLAKHRIEVAGLTDQITLLKQDYRDLTGHFDKLVSIEMIEAVGHEFLPAFFSKCSDLLKPDGQMLLQAITIPDQRYEKYRRSVDFIQKHIFPGGCLPSLRIILQTLSNVSDLQLVHFEDFASHYARTLAIWRDHMFARQQEIADMGRDEEFLRAWEYYFGYCEAGFRERQIGVGQLLFNKSGCRSEYLPG
jgi:cyclopropane-fatty-acyl-phospholipid synthase